MQHLRVPVCSSKIHISSAGLAGTSQSEKDVSKKCPFGPFGEVSMGPDSPIEVDCDIAGSLGSLGTRAEWGYTAANGPVSSSLSMIH